MFRSILAYLTRKIKRQRKMNLNDILDHNLKAGYLAITWDAHNG